MCIFFSQIYNGGRYHEINASLLMYDVDARFATQRYGGKNTAREINNLKA